jgi:hypothetical protein
VYWVKGGVYLHIADRECECMHRYHEDESVKSACRWIYETIGSPKRCRDTVDGPRENTARSVLQWHVFMRRAWKIQNNDVVNMYKNFVWGCVIQNLLFLAMSTYEGVPNMRKIWLRVCMYACLSILSVCMRVCMSISSSGRIFYSFTFYAHKHLLMRVSWERDKMPKPVSTPLSLHNS